MVSTSKRWCRPAGQRASPFGSGGRRAWRLRRASDWTARIEQSAHMDYLKDKIRNVPDFPKAGILFYDITTLLQDPAGFRAAIDNLVLPFESQGIDIVVSIESR